VYNARTQWSAGNTHTLQKSAIHIKMKMYAKYIIIALRNAQMLPGLNLLKLLGAYLGA